MAFLTFQRSDANNVCVLWDVRVSASEFGTARVRERERLVDTLRTKENETQTDRV